MESANDMNGLPTTDGPTGRSSHRNTGMLNFLIIGAGARGNAYAKALTESTRPVRISAVAEPIAFKSQQFGRKYVWKDSEPKAHQAFESWQVFLTYEFDRRRRRANGETVPDGVHGLFVCVLDELHAEIITAFAPLSLHIMSEKPLATTLMDCLSIYRSLQPPGTSAPSVVFSIGHVLHYSPHNMLLRKLLLEDEVIGEVLSIEHTEPVGWWHFSHSYVRCVPDPCSTIEQESGLISDEGAIGARSHSQLHLY